MTNENNRLFFWAKQVPRQLKPYCVVIFFENAYFCHALQRTTFYLQTRNPLNLCVQEILKNIHGKAFFKRVRLNLQLLLTFLLVVEVIIKKMRKFYMEIFYLSKSEICLSKRVVLPPNPQQRPRQKVLRLIFYLSFPGNYINDICLTFRMKHKYLMMPISQAKERRLTFEVHLQGV